jgi:hypothetical protein
VSCEAGVDPLRERAMPVSHVENETFDGDDPACVHRRRSPDEGSDAPLGALGGRPSAIFSRVRLHETRGRRESMPGAKDRSDARICRPGCAPSGSPLIEGIDAPRGEAMSLSNTEHMTLEAGEARVHTHADPSRRGPLPHPKEPWGARERSPRVYTPIPILAGGHQCPIVRNMATPEIDHPEIAPHSDPR